MRRKLVVWSKNGGHVERASAIIATTDAAGRRGSGRDLVLVAYVGGVDGRDLRPRRDLVGLRAGVMGGTVAAEEMAGLLLVAR